MLNFLGIDKEKIPTYFVGFKDLQEASSKYLYLPREFADNNKLVSSWGRQYILISEKTIALLPKKQLWNKCIAIASVIVTFVIPLLARSAYEMARTHLFKFVVNRYEFAAALTLTTFLGMLFTNKLYHLWTAKKETIQIGILAPPTAIKEKNGQITYLNPEKFCEKGSVDEKVNFAIITGKGSQTIIPVSYASADATEATAYLGTPAEALFLLASHPGSDNGFIDPIVKTLLTDPRNACLKTKDFLDYVLQNDEKGRPRILSLHRRSLIDTLELLCEQGCPTTDWIHAQRDDGDTLLTHWIRKKWTPIVKMLLKLEPKAITQLENRSLLKDILSNHDDHMCHCVLKALSKQLIPLTPEELWYFQMATATDNTSFNLEDFKKLPEETKIALYHIANRFGNLDVVVQLRKCGMGEDYRYYPGPRLIAPNMGFFPVQIELNNFLKELRRKKLLLTQTEFKELGPQKYIKKENDFGRILGRDFVSQIAASNNLKFIKAPKKLAVLTEGATSVSFKIDQMDCPQPAISFKNPSAITCAMTIYAERIEPKKRKLTLQEGIEFMIALEKTGYQDFMGQNFIFAEDGIYFIDTEFKDFNPLKPRWGAIEDIKEILNPDDVPAFEKAFVERKAAWEQTPHPQRADAEMLSKSPYKKLAQAISSKALTFKVSDLLAG